MQTGELGPGRCRLRCALPSENSSLIRTSGLDVRTAGYIFTAVIYGSVNPPLFNRIPRSARRILDVGCGDGTLARAIRAEWPAEVAGITYSAEEAERGREALNPAVVADLETYDPAPLGRFDVVICSHVLEHLSSPGRLLKSLWGNVATEGRLLVAVPNVLFWRQRIEFGRGRFRYTEGGLMDRTHLQFFDWDTVASLVEDAGYRVVERVADGSFPASRVLGPLRRPLDRIALTAAPGLFGWQFVLVAQPRPDFKPSLATRPLSLQ